MLNQLRDEIGQRLLRHERKRYSLIAQRSCAGIQRMDGSPGSRHRQGRGGPGADIFEREHRSLLLSGAAEKAVCFGLPPVGHLSHDSGQPQSACEPSTLFSSNLPVLASTPTSCVTPPFLISKE